MRRAVALLVAVGAALSAGCHASAPRLTRLSPSTADVSRGEVVVVIATGRGFDSLNVVRFGEIELRQVPRLSASELRFTVPTDDSQRPGLREMAPQPLQAGTYQVTVSNARGSSKSLPFELRRAP